jgi:hypothetical protein
VSSTNPGGSAGAALHALQSLAHTAARALQALLDGLLHRPHAARAGRTVSTRPVPPSSRTHPGRTEESSGAADAAGAAARAAHAYGQSRVVLVARDPWSLFAHWEIPSVRRIEVLRSLGADGEQAQEVLRLHDTATAPPTFHDRVLAPGATRAHIDVEHAGRSYRVEVGLRTAAGRFVPLATSNLASTPAAQRSDDTSVRWVALGADGGVAEVAVAWSGRRVTAVATATTLGPTPRVGSSETLPPGPRASDALPLR